MRAVDHTSRFSRRAEHYDAARPSYAPAFLRCLCEEYGFSQDTVIADIGSGTGKFTRQLLDRGGQVFAVEPNQDMRRKAEQALGSFPAFHSVSGTAEHTTLASCRVDAVTAAQSFHWFQAGAFGAECRRILRPGGVVVLVWNLRDMAAPVNQSSWDVFHRHCPAFRGFSNGFSRTDPKIREFFTEGFHCRTFPHPLSFQWEGFLRRCLSSSFSLRDHSPG